MLKYLLLSKMGCFKLFISLFAMSFCLHSLNNLDITYVGLSDVFPFFIFGMHSCIIL